MGREKAYLFDGFDRELSKLTKSLSHPARVAILLKLASVRGCSCAEFVEALPLAQATVSQHLASLVKLKLVTRTQQGQMSCYSVNFEKLERLSVLFQHFHSYMKHGVPRKKCCS